MSIIKERQEEIKNMFTQIDNWDSRYEQIIKLGKELQGLDEKERMTDHLVKGCQSQVWLIAKLNDQKHLSLRADSDALIVRGLISIVLQLFNNASPADILSTDITIFEDIGMNDHLSLTRKNGLNSIIKQIKYYALAFQTLIDRG